LKIGERWPSG